MLGLLAVHCARVGLRPVSATTDRSDPQLESRSGGRSFGPSRTGHRRRGFRSHSASTSRWAARRLAKFLRSMPGALAERGYFIGPHIFADVDPASRIAREEIFGPVLCVLKGGGFERGARHCQWRGICADGGRLFAQSGSSRSREPRVHGGQLVPEPADHGRLVNRQPFGGFKMSGIGDKAGGPDYLLQFVVARTITENTLRRGFAPSSE